MNIKILNSWLREYLKTDAKPEKIAELLSLTSVSVERLEKYKNDYLYDLEITTNRPDLMSVMGIARETAAILPQFGISAKFARPKLPTPPRLGTKLIEIKNNPTLVNRICAAVLDVKVKDSPKEIKEKLESSGIRSLNNLIDITNYVMRTIGHPAHVFDFEKLNSKNVNIEESKKGQKIITLDKKEHMLSGGDIIATDDRGEIVDLLGVMGLANSVVNDKTKRILFFIDNNEPYHIRKTSMSLFLRTEAASLNEKGLDPELAMDALLFGIKLYEELAEGKLASQIIDIYSNKPKEKTVHVKEDKINNVIGVNIPLTKSSEILKSLGFECEIKNESLEAVVPSFRSNDVILDVDLIEEIARVYGYHNIPSRLVSFESAESTPYENEFLWEKRIKETLKHWGFMETYTSSMVSQDLFEGSLDDALEIQNPLNSDLTHMRKTIVPSLLEITRGTKEAELKLFEIANIYEKKHGDLPNEILTLAGIIKKSNISFFEAKGIIEQLFKELGIKNCIFKNSENVSLGASISIDKEHVGEIEILDNDLIDFEINLEKLVKHATLKKVYKPIKQFPPVIEDLSIVVSEDIQTQNLMELIKEQSSLISEVKLFDTFKDSRTFHIIYQDPNKNLTTEEVSKVREKIIHVLKEKFQAKFK